MDVDEILKERRKSHGEYCRVSAMSQTLKNVLKAGDSYYQLNFAQKESIDMICSKLARIMNGDPDEIDHWLDIAGYSKLAAQEIGTETNQIRRA
jgi:hypothetical protein